MIPKNGATVKLDEEIRWWKEQCDKARAKELAMVCFGVATGLKLAKADYGAKDADVVSDDQS